MLDENGNPYPFFDDRHVNFPGNGTASDPYRITVSAAERLTPQVELYRGGVGLTVENVAPTAVGLLLRSPENSHRVDINATPVDVGTHDFHTVTVDWGDGTAPETGAAAHGVQSLHHRYARVGLNPGADPVDTKFTITTSAVDDDGGGPATGKMDVTVRSFAPAVEIGLYPGGPIGTPTPDGPYVAYEGAPVELRGLIDNAGPATWTTVVINWGDGTTTEIGAADLVRDGEDIPFTRTHVYANNLYPKGADGLFPAYHVTVEAVAAGFAVRPGAAADARIANHLPTNLDISADVQVVAGAGTAGQDQTTVRIGGTFDDFGDQDLHFAVVDWGDGAPEYYPLAAGMHTLTVAVGDGVITHTYTTMPVAGYRVRVHVVDLDETDKLGAEESILVATAVPADVLTKFNDKANELVKDDSIKGLFFRFVDNATSYVSNLLSFVKEQAQGFIDAVAAIPGLLADLEAKAKAFFGPGVGQFLEGLIKRPLTVAKNVDRRSGTG